MPKRHMGCGVAALDQQRGLCLRSIAVALVGKPMTRAHIALNGISVRRNKSEPSLRTLLRPFKPPCLLPRRKRTLWTKPYMVSPALVKHKFGDGKRLICLLPILHRPYYYLVWIDSKWDLRNGDDWFDQLDGIWEEIGNEFGCRQPDDTKSYRWPEEDSSGGCCWVVADADDVLPKRMRSRYA